MVIITENFTLGSCTESLEMDEKGRFIPTYSNTQTIPKVLARRQASVWFAEHYPNESLGDAISRAREWFASRQNKLSVLAKIQLMKTTIEFKGGEPDNAKGRGSRSGTTIS